jgi:prophage regulatory protein
MTLQTVHTAPSAPAPRVLVPRDKLLRLPDVTALTGCSKSTIYALMKKGEFPKSISITSRMSAWSESSVLTWVQARINEGAVQ